MGWSIGYDDNWKRDIGYGVPAVCDHPGCNEKIDRGLAYVCGGEPYGGEDGCGLYFCAQHLHLGVDGKDHQVCQQCANWLHPFEPKPDIAEWMHHKLTCPTWQQWRDENPSEVANIRNALKASATADSPQGVNTNEPTEANTDGTSNIETGNEKRIDP